jgi:hypothetical protein
MLAMADPPNAATSAIIETINAGDGRPGRMRLSI